MCLQQCKSGHCNIHATSHTCCGACTHLKVVSKVLQLAAPGVPELREAVEKQHQRLAATSTRCDRVEPAVPQYADDF